MASFQWIRYLALLLAAFLNVGCALFTKAQELSQEFVLPERAPVLEEASWTASDGLTLSYRSWRPEKEPEMVLLGVHGISGAAQDYEGLAKHLRQAVGSIAIYAPNLRGQGQDPREKMRGDLESGRRWRQDLEEFSRLLQARHPAARMVWFGESLGSVIVLNAFVEREAREVRVDALVLSSPIVHLRSKLPVWKELLFRSAALVMPTFRVALDQLGDEQAKEARVTATSIHQEQAKKTPWAVESYTLRQLEQIGAMVRRADENAAQIQVPLLVLYGGNDIFQEPWVIERFFQRVPAVDKEKRFYPEGYHLLLYDKVRQQVRQDVATWLQR
ncbi:MAG: alpha/beta fold hydrolase [Verrucomicrobiota bacterium]